MVNYKLKNKNLDYLKNKKDCKQLATFLKSEIARSLPLAFRSDFGLEIVSQVGLIPFKLTLYTARDLVVQASRYCTTLSFATKSLSLSKVVESSNLPIISTEHCMTIELAPTLFESQVKDFAYSLKTGVTMFANWKSRYTINYADFKDIVVPLHITPEEEIRLGLPHFTPAKLPKSIKSKMRI